MLRERFSRPLDEAALALSESTREDRSILFHDLWGSIAHASMLGERGIIPRRSARRLVAALRAVGREAAAGSFRLDPSLEDVHLNVEHRLTDRLGDDGARLHTGRSRNDQVATDLLLYERDALLDLETATLRVVFALLDQATAPSGRGTVPGWTHLQPAQRVYWAQVLGAHALRFLRDVERFDRARRGIRWCPLGSGALAGSSLPLDRSAVARDLGFDGPTVSSYDAVADRDSAVETLFGLTMVAVHASQLAEELVIGAMPEVARVRLADPFVTTSSLMPHKRNPDLAELVRAEAAPSVGRLVGHLTVLKGLPLSYQRDLQAGKPILFDGVRRGLAVLEVLAPMVASCTFLSPPRSPGESNGSVELVDALVTSGVPFREAHGQVAGLLRELDRSGRTLSELDPEEIARRFPAVAGFRLPEPDQEPELRRSVGGSSWAEIEKATEGARREERRLSRSVEAERRRLGTIRRRLGLSEEWFRPDTEAATSRRAAGSGRRR